MKGCHVICLREAHRCVRYMHYHSRGAAWHLRAHRGVDTSRSDGFAAAAPGFMCFCSAVPVESNKSSVPAGTDCACERLPRNGGPMHGRFESVAKTKMCHHLRLPLGLSKGWSITGSYGFFAISFYALVLAAILFARGADGFTCQTKRRLGRLSCRSCPHILRHHKHHHPVASSHIIPSIYRGCGQSRLFAVEANDNSLSEVSAGTVTILVPSPSSSGPSKFAVSEGDAPLSYLDAAKAIAAEVSDIASNSIHVSVEAVLVSSASSPSDIATTRQKASDADVLLGLGLSSPADVRYLSTLFRERRLSDINNSNQWPRCSMRCQFALDCGKPFAPIVGLYDEANPNLFCKIPWSNEAKGRETMYDMMDMFEKWNVQEFSKAIGIFFDRFG